MFQLTYTNDILKKTFIAIYITFRHYQLILWWDRSNERAGAAGGLMKGNKFISNSYFSDNVYNIELIVFRSNSDYANK